MTTQNKNAPALRFPEFSGEWSEQILKEWISEYRENSTENNQYVVLTSSNKGLMKQSDYYGENRITERDNVGFNVIPNGYITYRSRSDNRKFTFNLNNLGTTGIISVYYPVFTIKNGSNEFFVEYFNYHKHFLGKFSVGTSQQVLSLNDLRSIKLHIPSSEEQQKIAAFLMAVDEKIQQIAKKKHLLEQYKKGVMQKIFNQEIRLKDNNGNDFPAWEEKKLGEAGEINPKNKELPQSFIYIDLESVENGVLQKENLIQLENAPSRAQRLLRKNDILFQTVRPYQKNNLYFDRDGVYVASTGYAQIRTKNNPQYLYQFLHSDNFVNEVILRCTGTGYPAINSTDLSNISISLPTIPEQQKIADFLSGLDKKINLVKEQLQKTQEYKKCLLQKMFI